MRRTLFIVRLKYNRKSLKRWLREQKASRGGNKKNGNFKIRDLSYSEKHSIYLKSKHWGNLRIKKLKQKNHKCELCGSDQAMQVHHQIYRKPLSNGTLKDLLALCKSCHNAWHKHTKKRMGGEKYEIPSNIIKKCKQGISLVSILGISSDQFQIDKLEQKQNVPKNFHKVFR